MSPMFAEKAVALSAEERAELIDTLLSTFDTPEKEIETAWKSEVENRLQAFDRGEMKSRSFEEVMSKYKK